MKCTNLILALATMAVFATPACAQSEALKGMGRSLHGSDDTIWCENLEHSLEQRTRSCEAAIKEGHFDILLELAKLQRIAGDYDAALASIGRLTDRLPVIPTGYATIKSGPWLAVLEGRGEIYAQMGKFDEARADGDEIQHISVDSAAADNAQCWLRVIAGRELEQALDLCNKALERKPNIAGFHDSRGLAYFKLGKFQDALDDFDAALDKDPDMATSRYGRGVAKLRLGDVDGGRKDVADAEQRDLIIARMMAGYGVTQ